jgi:imidazolonepropionase-like amidohydrolase
MPVHGEPCISYPSPLTSTILYSTRFMRIRLFQPVGAGLALLALCLTLGCREQPPDGTALVGATLIDGSGRPPLTDAVVVVRRGKIESIGARADFHLPRRTIEVDATGRWIIPGLIDAHAHVARWALPRYLAWGVTTVRDVHGTLDSILELRREVNRGAILGPRIYSAGAMIDGEPTTYSDALPAANEKEARKQVDRLVNAGVDLIKVYSRVDPQLLQAVLDEASTFHVPVTGHLGLTDAVTAANLGIASIEHMSGVPEAAMADPSALYAAHRRAFFEGWTAFERSWASLDSASLARVAQTLAEKKVAIIPTLVLHDTFSRLDDSSVVQDSMLRYVPEIERQRWAVPDMVKRAGWQKTDFEAFQRSRPMQDLFLRLFAADGGRIAAGTDASNQLLIPGYSEHRELQLLVSAGLTPRDALLAATRNGALLLGVDSLGLIAPEKAADLIILRRDPMSQIKNTLSIDHVMLGGRLFSADSLRGAWQ